MIGCDMLDKSKPYGEIFGATDGGRYEQNGIVYDSQGMPLNSSSPVEVFAPTGSRQVIIEAPKKRGRPPKK